MITRTDKPKPAGQILLINTDKIVPNRNQPREYFGKEELDSLSESIRRNGIIQPLTVRKSGDHYELVAGERRLRAAKKANLKSVPCIVMEIDQQSSAVISLLENIQRSQLNFLEEAKAIKTLTRYYGMSQETIGASLGMSQCSVSNLMRILKLPEDVLTMLVKNSMTQRHARALLKLPGEELKEAAETICEKKMNVAETEKYIDNLIKKKEKVPRKRKVFFGDVKIFLNTINHAVETMQNAGIEALVERTENEDGFIITVNVPKAKKSV